jgi:hypothetical protein
MTCPFSKWEIHKAPCRHGDTDFPASSHHRASFTHRATVISHEISSSMAASLLTLAVGALLVPSSRHAVDRSSSSTTTTTTTCTRRHLLLTSSSAVGAAALLLPTNAALATGNMPAVQGATSNMDASVKKAATPDAAKKQIAAGYDALLKLLEDFDGVTSSGGGDGVRRALGVVGTDSPLYLIEPAFRLLFDADETLPMEYVDTLENLMRNLSSADSEAYSAIFIEFSSAKGKPEDYFKRSKAAVSRAKEDWKQLMGYLKM